MQQHLPIGHILQNGKYRILKVLGQGGFSVTYLAQHILFLHFTKNIYIFAKYTHTLI